MLEEEYSRAWEEYRVAKNLVGDMVKRAIGGYEASQLAKVREKGNGETRDWYRFLRGKNVKMTVP